MKSFHEHLAFYLSKIKNIVFIFAFGISGLGFIGPLLKYDFFLSYSLWISTVSCLILFIVQILFFWIERKEKGNNTTDSNNQLFSIISCLIGIVFIWVSAFIGNTNFLDFSYFRKAVFYTSLFMLFFSLSNGTPPAFAKYLINSVAILFTMVAIFVYLIPYGQRFHTSGGMILNFSNPNLFGMVCCIMAFWLLWCSIDSKKIGLKIGNIAFSIIDAVFLYFSNSRNAQTMFAIGLLLLIVFLFWGKIRKNIKNTTALALVSLSPLIFADLYVIGVALFFPNATTLAFQTTAEFSGKSIFTRFEIWVSGLKMFANNPFFGSYFESTAGTGASQLHNTAIDTISSFGISSYLCFLFSMTSFLKNRTRSLNLNNKTHLSSFAYFIGTFMLGIFEASLFNAPYFLFLLLGFLYLAPEDSQNNTRRKCSLISTKILKI